MVDIPVVHAVRGLPIVDIAELVIDGQVERATTNFVVFSTAIPPSKEISTTTNQLSQELLSKVKRG